MLPVLMLLLSQFACRAAAEVVVLDNGDRLSGEVLKIEEGKLSLKTEYAGIVTIAWNRVQKFSSSRPYQMETGNGLRLTGSLFRSGQRVDLLTSAGPVQLTPDRILRATPVAPGTEAGFWRALEGSADVGYSFTRGNADLSQSSLSVNARYRTDGYKLQLDLGSLFARQQGASGASRHSGAVRFDRFLSPDAFLYTNLGLERDERRLLNLRTNAGGGVGWKLIQAPERELSLLGGFNFVNEDYRVQPGAAAPAGASGEGQIGLDWRTAAPAGVQFTTRVALTPNIVQLGRYRLAIESGARVPLIGRYVWSVNVFNRFDSRPPVEAQRTDYGAISSFGFSF